MIVTEACHHLPARRFGPHEVRDRRVVAEGEQDSQAGGADQQHLELGHKCSLQSSCGCSYSIYFYVLYFGFTSHMEQK